MSIAITEDGEAHRLARFLDGLYGDWFASDAEVVRTALLDAGLGLEDLGFLGHGSESLEKSIFELFGRDPPTTVVRLFRHAVRVHGKGISG